MADYNTRIGFVTVEGNLTRKPQLETSRGGKDYTRLTIAVNGMKDKDGNEPEPAFIDAVAFNSLAENAVRSLDKGSSVVAELSLSHYKREVGYLNEDDEYVEYEQAVPSYQVMKLGVNLRFGAVGGSSDEGAKSAPRKVRRAAKSESSEGEAPAKAKTSSPIRRKTKAKAEQEEMEDF